MDLLKNVVIELHHKYIFWNRLFSPSLCSMYSKKKKRGGGLCSHESIGRFSHVSMASNSQKAVISLFPCYPCLIIFFFKNMIEALRSLILCQIWLKISWKVKSLLEQETNRQCDHVNLIFKGQQEKKWHLKLKSQFLSVLKWTLIHLVGEKPCLDLFIMYCFFLLMMVLLIFDFQRIS